MSAMRAMLFDLDGTLYHQMPLRALMALELGLQPWTRMAPRKVRELWRTLRTFRTVREELRAHRPADGPLGDIQYAAVAARLSVAESHVRAVVAEWIFERPLKYLPLARRRDADRAFSSLHNLGISIGVFSDYPVEDKLLALGLRQYVSLTLCATDSDVNAFKPHPRGFLRACERWGLPPSEVLYVGDRVEVDAAGAAAAGMRCAILGATRSDSFHTLANLSGLLALRT
jgi:phosphoglycolate phosphatase/putative hydrolase of the HAD superfamily